MSIIGTLHLKKPTATQYLIWMASRLFLKTLNVVEQVLVQLGLQVMDFQVVARVVVPDDLQNIMITLRGFVL